MVWIGMENALTSVVWRTRNRGFWNAGPKPFSKGRLRSASKPLYMRFAFVSQVLCKDRTP